MTVTFSKEELIRSGLDSKMYLFHMYLTELDAEECAGGNLRGMILRQIGELESEYGKYGIKSDVLAFADTLAFLATEEENHYNEAE